MPLKCSQVGSLIVGGSCLPAPEEDANPFERQGTHGRLVILASFDLGVVVRLGPCRPSEGVSGELNKALSRELGAMPSPVDPHLIAAAFHDRGDAVEGGYIERRLEPPAIRPEERHQTRGELPPRAGEAVEDAGVGMVLE